MKTKSVILILGLIIFTASLVRTYKFHDWLFFKWDQARDATLISQAIENGPSELPLLGPRATKVGGGEYLRLGPAYYYMQYASGAIFGSTKPDVFAYPDLLFSILAIPMLFLLLRFYFSRTYSLLLVFLYSFSFLVIQYSRFSWNPNSVPFFAFLGFYGLLKFFNPIDQKSKCLWIFLWALAMAIASQLHFFAFFSLIGVSTIFIAIKNKLWKISSLKSALNKKTLKYALLALVTISFIYAPVLVNEAATGGQNTKNFIKAFSAKPQDKPIWEKIKRNTTEQLEGYYLITTSYNYGKNEKIGNFLEIAVAGFIIIAGYILLAGYYRKTENQQKKDFLLLVALWPVLFYLVSIPMAYQIRPRFFVVVFAMPYIFLGLILKFIGEKRRAESKYIIAVIVLALFLLNGSGTCAWFKENRLSQSSSFDTNRTLILEKKDGVTLGQLERAIQYISREIGNDLTLYYYTKPEYRLSLEYLLLQNNPRYKIFRLSDTEYCKSRTCFAMVTKSGGFDSIKKDLKTGLYEEKSQQFGQLLAIKLSSKTAETVSLDEELRKKIENYEEKELEEDLAEDDDNLSRVLWKNVLN